jgi:hypothetical protein
MKIFSFTHRVDALIEFYKDKIIIIIFIFALPLYLSYPQSR